MAHHASVNYVEPNLTSVVNEGGSDNPIVSWKSEDDFFERAPRLEDYCIMLNLEVEVCSRNNISKNSTITKDVLIMSYRTDQGSKKSSVNFMGGTKVLCDNEEGMTIPYLTTNYADMYVGDLIDYGTTEMIGIKSIDIEYQKSCVPLISIKFTDVRGLSVFQPTELSRANAYQGIYGLNADNVAQSFFQCFFRVPKPKFTITIKGFYGKPVSYEMLCDKFETKFNPTTGDFDVDTKFIGYSYSFLTDISIDALFAAPYSDYHDGESYWNEQKKDRFRIWNREKTALIPMPTMFEIWQEMQSLLRETAVEGTALTQEEMTHEEEIESLRTLKNQFDDWYATLFNICTQRYGKDFCYAFRDSTSDKNYTRILILADRNADFDLSEEYKKYPDTFKEKNQNLYAAVKEFNSKKGFRKLDNVSIDFFDYDKVTLFNDTFLNQKGEVVFNGFHRTNKLPQTQVINNVFYGETYSGNTEEETNAMVRQHRDYVLSTIYNDGVNQKVFAYSIAVDYSALGERIKALQNDANRSEKEKEHEKRIKEVNKAMFAKMSWFPSIENFTKIVMAHFETLMAMMYKLVSNCEGRKAIDLGVTAGADGTANDVPQGNEVIPPFPRVAKTVLGEDNISKVEDSWVGEYEQGKIGFEEVDFINGLFNAIEKIRAFQKNTNIITSEMNGVKELGDRERFAVKKPLASMDFCMTRSPYGEGSEISNDEKGYEFAGRVGIRMFNILAFNYIDREIGITNLGTIEDIAKAEAENFHDNVKITNENFLEALKNGIFDADNLLDKLTKSNDDTSCPWGKRIMFAVGSDNDTISLDGYKVDKNGYKKRLIPIEDVSFSRLEEVYSAFNQGKMLVDDNRNGVTDISKEYSEGSFTAETNGFGSTYISDDMSIATNLLNGANSSYDEGYTKIYEKLCELTNFDSNSYNDYITSTKPSVRNRINYKKNDTPDGFLVDNDAIFMTKGGQPMGDGYTYSTDASSFGDEASKSAFNSYVLNEVYGVNSSVTSMDFDSSFVETNKYIDNKNAMKCGVYTLADKYYKAAVALMCISTSNVGKAFNSKKTFIYAPRIAVLKVGAILFASGGINAVSGLESGSNGLQQFKQMVMNYLPIGNNHNDLISYAYNLSKVAKVRYIRYFYKWAINSSATEMYNNLANEDNYYKPINDSGKNRRILKEDLEFVKNLTNDLFRPILVIRMSKIHEKGVGFQLSRGKAKIYLDTFVKRLKELLTLEEPESEGGGVTRVTDEPKKTTIDMKKELYRYMKQLYDKWIPMSSFKDWKLESFFGNDKEDIGHKFYFIDSYYNYIGHKLLINPKHLSTIIGRLMDNGDVNAMLLGFLGEIFGMNKCMLMCLQNFAKLNEIGSMNETFTPIPFNAIDWEHLNKHPSFVVVYPYEMSKCLNVASNEYNNDGFMLNDENETPLAIRTKDDKDGQYRVPAFGVSYGKQYQSFFKSVNVSMANPIATQQSILAKHYILQNMSAEREKGIVAQDLYDVYSTQSFTCEVEMMGCAWIQPLMYFVLLNIPMFNGSYLILKVKHSIRPGDMTTRFTGCRMANVTNKLVEDIFTDEDFMTGDEDVSIQASSNDEDVTRRANTDNDCPYKVFPLFESSSLNGDEMQRAKAMMDKVMNIVLGSTDEKAKIAAAGIVGNMAIESTTKLDYLAVNGNDKGYIAAGLCGWNDRYFNLTNLLKQNTKNYGKEENKNNYLTVNDVRKGLEENGLDYQLEFLRDTISQVGLYGAKNKNYSKEILLNCKTAGDAAISFENSYERSDKKKNTQRRNKAEDYYKAYASTKIENTSNPNKNTNEDINEALFRAVEKSLDSTTIGVGVKLKKDFVAYNNDSKGAIQIKQENGGTNILPLVFDIILNGYSDYVLRLWWRYKNDTKDVDSIVFAAKMPKITTRKIIVSQTNNQGNTMTNYIPSDSNEGLLKSLAKYRAKVGDKAFIREMGQLSSLDILDKWKPESCVGENYASSDELKNYQTKEMRKTIDGQKIGDWNVSASVNYLIEKFGNKKTGDGYCYRQVKTALVRGGFKYAVGEHAYQAKDWLLKNGFDMIKKGSYGKNGSGDYNGVQLGDITVFERYHDGKNQYHKSGHIHMWCGSSWISDYKIDQNCPSIGNKGNDTEYSVWRYSGHGKA